MMFLGVPLEWLVFLTILVGIIFAHRHAFWVVLFGFLSVIFVQVVGQVQPFSHLYHEMPLLLDLMGLLIGFEILSEVVSQTHIPQLLPRFLPDDWRGGLVLLAITALLATFIDHIAAALIGGSIAIVVYQKRVHLGYVTALVGASNLGGVGSVLGNITTTMMWLHGVPALSLLVAYFGALVAFLVMGIPASLLQQRYAPIVKDEIGHVTFHMKPATAVMMMIGGVIAGNLFLGFPAVGLWVAIMLAQFYVPSPLLHGVKRAMPNSLFLVLLVGTASLMPLGGLPAASVMSTFFLGVGSAFFDNIPLTQLALRQGGYHWPLLSYCVGFGGSMLWFGSSAGVAICTLFPEAKSAKNWAIQGWFLPVAYGAGFLVLWGVLTLFS